MMNHFRAEMNPVETGIEPAETEPPRESTETVRQLLDGWKERFESDETPGDEKQEVAYRIVKLGEALSRSGLSAEEVKIREAEPGVLGFYVPATGEIAMTPAGLELPPQHFSDVLVHEATHAGLTTGKKVADEGVTQIITRSRLPGAMHGIYEQEQRQAHETFAVVDMKRVIDQYDFERPRELIDLYLATEWHDVWESKWQEDIGLSAIGTTEERKEFIEGSAHKWVEQIEQALEDAAPRLLDKAKAEGFDFSQAHQESLEQLVNDKKY